MCHSLKISTHTFLLVKLCGKQGKEQHGKAIRHLEGQLSGVLRVTGEVKCGKKIRQSKSNMNQLTLSLDYTWNEKGMTKKKREVGKKNKEEE